MRIGRVVKLLALACTLLLASEGALEARGGRGGGRMGGGGYSRSQSSPRPAERRAPSDRSATRGYGDSRESARARDTGASRGELERDGSRSNERSFETRRGETVDWESEVTRGEDGPQRETSWASTSGASGSGSSTARVQGGQVQVDRSRHAESGSGETIDREWSAHREDDWIVREGSVKTNTGVDADTASAIRRTEDGYVVRGAAFGRRGDAAGTIVKKGDELYARGARVEGDDVTFGRVHCQGDRCTGGRVTADLDDDYDYPYYYYP
jgi:hypothetical protein